MPTRTDETEPGTGPVRPPLEPPNFRKVPWKSLAAVFFAAAIGVAAAFNFDLCGAFAGVGITLDSCKAPPAPSPTPAADAGP